MVNAVKDKSKNRITLIDVAEDAGVSRATVSLVLRDSPLVAEETRARVQNSIRKLGYVYNRAAASLRTQRSLTVGLIISDISNPFFAELTLGIEAHLDESNYLALLSNTSEQTDKQDRILDTLQEQQADGVLLCPAQGTNFEALKRLREWRLPFVLVVRYLPGIEADYVGADNALGAKLAVEHLVKLGHRRIAFIGGAPDSSARRDRVSGYYHALQNYNLKIDDSLLITSPVTRTGGREAVLALLKRPDPPTATLCYNDIVAFGVMLGLQSAGHVPGKDFSVVGFDDIKEAALQHPPLTTVSISPRQIGKEAAQLLLERVANPADPARQIILPPRLIIRESSRPHPDLIQE